MYIEGALMSKSRNIALKPVHVIGINGAAKIKVHRS